MSVSKTYTTIWKKEAIDLAELAQKRWVEKWTIEKIAAHMGWGRTAVVRYLGRLKANPDLILDGRVRSHVKSRKYRVMGS
ncbi:hypothetical protein [Bdellovibrio svalbardensis]|uniref:Uncharacterized protein n=1 Tax=Bdellovibrio svalbardensis TaxID=2972972 RepID=A0ABT6DMG3_9BACT|nr:hypothetical protein [Bdellovibrio svalbardensis]MDG0818069.1 hypothetical protein [Bdellovibrio svalbardensis]